MITTNVFCFVLLSCCSLQEVTVCGTRIGNMTTADINKNANLLIEAINEHNVDNLLNNFTTHFEYNTINKIFAKAIKESFKSADLFTSMLATQLELSYRYRRVQYEASYGHSFMISYATNLYHMIGHHYFPRQSLTLRTQTYNVWYGIGETADVFFKGLKFCLLNIKENKFIYTGWKSSVDQISNNNNIWLWHDNNSIDVTSKIRIQILKFYEDNGTKFDVVVIGTAYEMCYVMADTEHHYIQGWELPNPKGYIWTIKFLDYDRVVFTQQNYIMCAVEQADDQRQNVAGRLIADEFSASHTACQWRLGKCIA